MVFWRRKKKIDDRHHRLPPFEQRVVVTITTALADGADAISIGIPPDGSGRIESDGVEALDNPEVIGDLMRFAPSHFRARSKPLIPMFDRLEGTWRYFGGEPYFMLSTFLDGLADRFLASSEVGLPENHLELFPFDFYQGELGKRSSIHCVLWYESNGTYVLEFDRDSFEILEPAD